MKMTKIKGLFALYLLLLVWGILFKLDIVTTVQQAYFSPYRSVNLIPFAGTAVYDGYLDVVEIGLNVLAFVPFGLFLEMLRKEAEWLSQLVIVGTVSVVFELVQYHFALGVADITDVLGNSFGGAIGIVCYYLLSSYWREKTEVRLQPWLAWGLFGIFAYALVTGF